MNTTYLTYFTYQSICLYHIPVICHWSEYPAETIYLSYVTYRSIRWKSSTCRNTLIRSTRCAADHLPVTCHWSEYQVYIIYLSHVSDRGTRCCAYIIPITCYWTDDQHIPIDRDHLSVACHWPENSVETIYLVHISDRIRSIGKAIYSSHVSNHLYHISSVLSTSCRKHANSQLKWKSSTHSMNWCKFNYMHHAIVNMTRPTPFISIEYITSRNSFNLLLIYIIRQ